MKKILFIFISISFMLMFHGQLFAKIQADAYIGKKRIYIFQSLNLTVSIKGDYNSVVSAGYLDETLLNDFEIKNTSVRTSSSYPIGSNSYSRVMVYELTPIRGGKSTIPSVSILYEDDNGDGYITTDAMSVRVYGKGAFVFHIILYSVGAIIVLSFLILIFLGIRNARKTV